MSPWHALLLALPVLCGLFAALYFQARALDNYGIVDVAWDEDCESATDCTAGQACNDLCECVQA